MVTFRYAAYDATGRQVRGTVDAADAHDATSQLRGRGLLPFETSEAGVAAKRSARSLFSRRPMSLVEHADFARQFATLLQAELPLDQCLKLMAVQGRRSPSGRLASGLVDAVTSGKALSGAFEASAATAPAFIAPLIRAGEARGSLAPALADVARILERQAEVSSRIKAALTYPMILLFVALISVGVIVGVLVPTLMPLFRDNRIPPPGVLRVAQVIEQTVRENWLAVVVGVLGATFIAIAISRLPAVRRSASRFIARLPMIGALVQRTNTALMARTLGTLLRNGVALVPSLKLCATVVGSEAFRGGLGETAQAVQEGSKLATALQRTGLLAELPMRFIAIGEEASKLDDMLLHLAELSDTENIRQIERLLTLLTPVITLTLGGLIGGLILTVMQTVLSINDFAFK